MRESMPDQGPEDQAQVGGTDWKVQPFAAGHAPQIATYAPLCFVTFLMLVAIHTSIFLLPRYPSTSVILLLALIRGWLSAA